MKSPEHNWNKLNDDFEIAAMVNAFLEGRLSGEESDKLSAWIAQNDQNRQTWAQLTDPDYLEKRLAYWNTPDLNTNWRRIESEIRKHRPAQLTAFRKSFKYAAILLPFLLIGAAAWYLVTNANKSNSTHALDLAQTHILPKGKVARLVLGNGQVINLSDSLPDAITEKDGTTLRNKGSILSYSSGDKENAMMIYNTLIIPKGGEYQVTLSDGTKVWLNAASSLRYPTRFKGDERKVFLSGEGYFEVAKDVKHPFIVEAGNTEVKVLGTRFNMSAYTEDAKKRITLAEGSVRVGQKGEEEERENGVLLKPGYGAIVKEDYIQVRKVNVQAALAWKDGMFIFDSESLGSIMKKLSRWYNVEIKYENGVDTLFHFTGRIKKHEELSGILHLIELTGKVKFSVEGNEIDVRSANND